MQCCANCGQTEDLRLFHVHIGDQVRRRWWCLECSFSARRLGVNAEPAPAWIERAALHQLPMKPLTSARAEAEVGGPNLSRLALVLASQHLLALAAQPDALAVESDEVRADEPVDPVATSH